MTAHIFVNFNSWWEIWINRPDRTSVIRGLLGTGSEADRSSDYYVYCPGQWHRLFIQPCSMCVRTDCVAKLLQKPTDLQHQVGKKVMRKGPE